MVAHTSCIIKQEEKFKYKQGTRPHHPKAKMLITHPKASTLPIN
jgi:hypothetical protein